MDRVFVFCLALWALLSCMRLAHMYDRSSRLGRWRKWDRFRLIPVGAFFSPRVPQSEYCLLFRDVLADGCVTAWTEAPRLHRRRWLHILWNPQKQIYRARTEVARSFFSAAADLTAAGGAALPPSFVFSEPYLAILRHMSSLPRISRPSAIQFAVMERDILSGQVIRMLLSSAHEL